MARQKAYQVLRISNGVKEATRK